MWSAYEMLDAHTGDYQRIGIFASRQAAEQAARRAVAGSHGSSPCDPPLFAAADGGGYWHPDETAVSAFVDRDAHDQDTALIAWVAAAD